MTQTTMTFYKQSELLRRGWTPTLIRTLIRTLLGIEDGVSDNPHHAGRPIKHFESGRVEKSELTPAFIKRQIVALAKGTLK